MNGGNLMQLSLINCARLWNPASCPPLCIRPYVDLYFVFPGQNLVPEPTDEMEELERARADRPRRIPGTDAADKAQPEPRPFRPRVVAADSFDHCPRIYRSLDSRRRIQQLCGRRCRRGGRRQLPEAAPAAPAAATPAAASVAAGRGLARVATGRRRDAAVHVGSGKDAPGGDAGNGGGGRGGGQRKGRGLRG